MSIRGPKKQTTEYHEGGKEGRRILCSKCLESRWGIDGG